VAIQGQDHSVRYIDAFNHFFPKRFFAGVLETPAAQKDMGKRIRGIPALWNLEERLRVVDFFPDYSQIISLAMPAIDRLWDPAHAPEWARIGNDELAELVAAHPDRFPGYAASLPMNAPEAAIREAERVLKHGANAIQLHTNVNGAPIDQDAFLPIYEIIEKSGRPILLHPIRTREMADYRTETSSKYEINSVIGWPFETGAALARLVFSGIMDRYPDLKVITHHLGGIIPYFEGRVGHSWDQLGSRTSDEDYASLLKRLKKRPLDYFKEFYGDTALAGARAPTVCGISFFTPDRVLFASDCPFDPEKGRGYIRATIEVIESLALTKDDREKICHRNAETMFALTSS
jgi:aminocarboxymuconate-semialdehyde decarboxylase